MSKKKIENWSPDDKRAFEYAKKSNKKLQHEVDELARNKKEGGFDEFLKDYSGGGGSGGSSGGGGCGGGY